MHDCETCDHRKNPQGGHCYMFREPPETACQIHTSLPYRAHLLKQSSLATLQLVTYGLAATLGAQKQNPIYTPPGKEDSSAAF